MRLLAAILLSPLMLLNQPIEAASMAARCSVVPKGESAEQAVKPCMFSQTQGYVDIRWIGEERNFLELTPLEGVGNFVDASGKAAYRKKGLGSDGVVFDTSIGLVRVYWGA